MNCLTRQDMPTKNSETEETGVVGSLHVHSTRSTEPMVDVTGLTLVAEKGIQEDKRYFDRLNSAGRPRRRQVTLMEREQISEHADALNLPEISPGAVRANIETRGISLIECIGKELQIGEAVICVYEARTPCSQMDVIAKGLRELMENSRQGVLAEVIQSGTVRIGDKIRVLTEQSRANTL
jgi:MOSC domain-containing protein YiiM